MLPWNHFIFSAIWMSSASVSIIAATKEKPVNDGERFELLLSQIAGKRLTYAEVTGKVGERTAN